MELRHLRYFIAVASNLNFSEAARRLHVAQAAISQTILDLEDELAVKLLSRNSRGVELTAAGNAFFAEAQGVMLRADGARIAAQGSNVYITWMDIKPNGQKQVMFRASNDNGRTFGNPIVVYNGTSSSSDTASSSSPMATRSSKTGIPGMP